MEYVLESDGMDGTFEYSSIAQPGDWCTEYISHEWFECVKLFVKMDIFFIRVNVKSYPAAPWSGTFKKSKLCGCCEILPDPPDICRGKAGRVILVYNRFF